MKIVDRQTVRIPLILSLTLFFFSITIFLFFRYYREAEFHSYLESTAINRVKLLFDNGVNPSQFKNIDLDLKESAYTNRQNIFYDSTGKVIYKSENAIAHLTPELIPKILKKKIAFERNGFERILFSNRENDQKKLYIIEASAYDLAGFDKQEKLLYMLFFSNLMLISLIVVITRYYISKDLRPIGNIAKRMKSISSKNLHERLPEASLKNEIGQMSRTFNELLDRVDASYTQQRNFVSYATHELRTPLSILLGNAQVTLMKDRTPAEYKQTVENFQFDINNMINLVNSLLELARMNADSQAIPFKKIRIDELLWQASDTLKTKHPDYKINIEFDEIPLNDEKLIVNANMELMALVFFNLMENACKYSENHKVEVNIFAKNKEIKIQFKDEGIGMTQQEMEHIFEAFYRTEKTKEISGHGVGLPLCKRILEIHQSKIFVNSIVNKGSIFTVNMPIANH